jgi:hypothetical protein
MIFYVISITGEGGGEGSNSYQAGDDKHAFHNQYGFVVGCKVARRYCMAY